MADVGAPLTAALRSRLRLARKNAIKAIAARPTTPPTTPPAMAPVFDPPPPPPPLLALLVEEGSRGVVVEKRVEVLLVVPLVREVKAAEVELEVGKAVAVDGTFVAVDSRPLSAAKARVGSH